MIIKRDGNMTASVKSPRIAVNKNFLKDFDLAFDNRDSSLNASAVCSAISLAGVNMLSDNLLLYARGNTFGAGFTYDNGTDLANKGEMYLTGRLDRDSDGNLTVNAKTLPSFIWGEDDGVAGSEAG